jgi:hypothetical protein
MPETNHRVTLDRERTLKFDYNSLCDVETATGRNVAARLTSIDFTLLRGLLWAGLKHEDPDLTLEGVGELIRPRQIKKLTSAVAGALSDFFDEKN